MADQDRGGRCHCCVSLMCHLSWHNHMADILMHRTQFYSHDCSWPQVISKYPSESVLSVTRSEC